MTTITYMPGRSLSVEARSCQEDPVFVKPWPSTTVSAVEQSVDAPPSSASSVWVPGHCISLERPLPPWIKP